MSDEAVNHPCSSFKAPVSTFTGPIAELVGHGLLSPPSRPGLLATLDRFEILRVVGAGGMGIVLLARDGQTGEQVAIKMIRPELLADHQIVHRFLKEAGHLQRLRHQNVIPVLEVSDREQGPYFVMPFFEQGNLARRIHPGEPLGSEVVLEISLQICEALQFAHRRGIIHRDLKPANILLAADRKACLADFGLARTVFNDTVVEADNQHCEGTAPYMSPGVAAGNAEDTRCDIYAFGALLYEMLTGEPPYKGRTTKEIREQILAHPPRAILDLNPKADRSLTMIAEGGMQRELRDRYADVSDILADLQRVKAGNAALGPRGAVGRVWGSGRFLWLVLAALGTVAVVSWMAWHNRAKAPTARVVVAEAFQAPWGVAVDGGGNLYVADSQNGTISRISPEGQATTLAGRAGYLGVTNGIGSDAAFIIPRGVALDAAGNLFVTDAYTVRKVTSGGVVTTLAGQKGYPGTADGVSTNAQFSWASAVAVDGAGNIYVADRYTIRKVTPAGAVTTLAGSPGHAGSNDGTGSTARFSDRDKGIAVDRAGNMYVADTFNHMIRKITPAGAVTTLAGSIREGSADGLGTNAAFATPWGVAIDASGVLYVADSANHTIRKVTPAGAVSTVAGTAGTAGSTDGAASRALFNQPRGMAVDSAGNIYVADTGNRSLRKITPSGLVTTLAGRISPLALKQ